MTIEAASLAAEITVEGADTAAGALTRFGRQVDDTATRMQGGAQRSRQHGEALREFGTGAALAGVALTGAFVGTTAVTANFDQAMSGVAATSNATKEQLGLLRTEALAAGRDTVFSASQAAQAEAELAKAGVSVSDIAGGALRGSLALAAAGQLDLATSATISAQAMNIFGLAGKDVTHIADVLAAGANKSAADVLQLGDALRQGGLVAKQTGIGLEDTVAVLALFADNALIGSDAGTSLKTMLQRLTPQSDEARETMRALGISAYDAQGNFVGLDNFAGQLQRSLGGLTAEQRNTALATIFGSDAVRAASILYDAGAAGVRDYAKAVDDGGAASRMASVQLDNLAGDVEQLKGSLETAIIQGGSQATGVLRGMTQAATGLVNEFSEAPAALQGIAIGFTGIAGTSLVVVGGLARIVGEVQRARDAFTALSTVQQGALGAVTGALVIGGIALANWAREKEQARQRTQEFIDVLRQDSGEIAANTREYLTNQLARDELLDDLQGLSGHLSSGRDVMDVYTAAIGGNAAAQRELRQAMVDAGVVELNRRNSHRQFVDELRDADGLLRGGWISGNVALAEVIDDQTTAYQGANAQLRAQNEMTRTAAAVRRDLTAAEQEVADLAASGTASAGDLARARARVAELTDEQAKIDEELARAQQQANSAADDGVDAFGALGNQAGFLSGALNNVGQSGYNAQAGIESATAAIIGQFGRELDARDAARDLNDALSDLDGTSQRVGASSGGAAGASKTAAQAYFEQADKARALRDAQLGVSQASRQVADAQREITRAHDDAAQATERVEDAQRRLQQILRGEGAGSANARDAAESLTDVQRELRGVQLDVADAEDELARVRADGSSTPREIERAELRLEEARDRAEDATTRLEEAQRIYNGTVRGFPPSSEEAREAQQQLTEAQADAEEAARRVTDAQLSLEEALRRVGDTSLAVERAQADLRGELDQLPASAGGASAALRPLNERIDFAARRALDWALEQAKVNGALEGTDEWARIVKDSLQGVIDQHPELAPVLQGVVDALSKELPANAWPNQLEQKLSVATAKLDELDAFGRARENQPSALGTLLGTFGIDLPGAASGGRFGPGQTFTVGEEGWEILRTIPGGGVEVLSNPQSRRALASDDSGTPQHVVQHVYNAPIYAQSAAEFADEVDKRERRRALLAGL